MDADPLAEIRSHLRHAARIIRRNGLHQGEYYADDPGSRKRPPQYRPVCALGAVNTAVTGSPAPNLHHQRLSTVMGHLSDYMHAHHGGQRVVQWNDQDGRTVEQMALLLRRAAAWTPTDTLALAA